jgi:hypothetical protein
MDQTKLNQALLDLESALTNDGGWATNQSVMFKTDVSSRVSKDS